MRPAELPGRLLERRSNASSRGMIAPPPQGGATEPGLSADFHFLPDQARKGPAV